MVSKTSAPHSIRFKNELWERVVVCASARGITPNEAVIELVTKGLERPRPAEKIAAGLNDAIAIVERLQAAEKSTPKPEPFKTRLKGEWSPPGGKKR